MKPKRKKSKGRGKAAKEYSFVERESQVIHRRNHAPLGRPPTDPVAKRKYDAAKAKPTRYARK